MEFKGGEVLYRELGIVLPESYLFINTNVTAIFAFHFAYFADEIMRRKCAADPA